MPCVATASRHYQSSPGCKWLLKRWPGAEQSLAALADTAINNVGTSERGPRLSHQEYVPPVDEALEFEILQHTPSARLMLEWNLNESGRDLFCWKTRKHTNRLGRNEEPDAIRFARNGGEAQVDLQSQKQIEPAEMQGA